MPRLYHAKAQSRICLHYVKLEENEEGSSKVKYVHYGRVYYYYLCYSETSSLRSHNKHFLKNLKQKEPLSSRVSTQ